MKKIKLFLVCGLMSLLSLGQAWGADVTWSWNSVADLGSNNSTTTSSDGDKTLAGTIGSEASSKTWTLSMTSKTTKYYLMNGQFGSTTNACSAVSLTTSAFTQAIKYVKVHASAAGTATITITVGTTKYVDGVSLTSSDAEYKNSTEGSSTGDIQISFSQPSTSKNMKIYSIEVVYDGGGAALSSVVVSGTPTKTSYSAGENFDPAGLTVTGTYSDASSGPISSGITWSYNPSQTLALNQTSIGVTATVSSIASEEYNVTGLTVTAAAPQITITATSSGISTTYGDGNFTQDGVTFSYIQWLKSTTNIQAKKSTSPSLTNTTAIPGNITSITVVFGEGKTAYAVTMKGSSDGSSWSSITSPATASTMVFDFSDYEYSYFQLNTPGNACYFDKIVIDYEAVAPASVAKPTITVGDEYFAPSTTVEIACTTDGATIYYTTDGSDPKTSGTKQTYDGTPFSVTETTTIRAIANKGEDWSLEAANKTANKLTPITPSAALDIINAMGSNGTTPRNYLVQGTICEGPTLSVVPDGVANYYISADGTTTNQLQVYNGKYIGGANFTSADQLQAGDDVSVVGKLKKYNSYKEFDANNAIVTHKPKARLAWSVPSYTASLTGANTFPTLTNTNGVAVTYSSSNTSVASFMDASNYGSLQINAVGEDVTITATFDGNSEYKANAVSYTLTVEDNVDRGTISFNVDGGDAIAAIPDATELPDPLPVPTKAGQNFDKWYTNSAKTEEAVPGAAVTEDITLYATWRDPYTVTEALTIISSLAADAQTENEVYVTGLVSTASTANPSSGTLTYSISADGTTTSELKVWKGKGVDNAEFTAKTDIQVNDRVVVYGKLYNYSGGVEINTPNHLYSFFRKAEAGLAWSEPSAIVGMDQASPVYPSLTNPHSLTAITYSSSDPSVASFADENTYEITLNSAGTVTITATFAGNEDYKEGSASYSLEVREVMSYGNISFECNGANSCPDGIVAASSLPNPIPSVVKDGCKFGGWFMDPGFTTPAVAGAAITEDVTLYAKWYTIPDFSDAGYEWQLVTSSAQLVAGKFYVLGLAPKSATAKYTIASGALEKVASTFADGVIASNALGSGSAIFVLDGTTGAWTLMDVVGASTGLLGGAGTASIVWGGENTAWPITIDAESNAVIGDPSGNRIMYNVSSPRFKPYTSAVSATMMLPQLYVWAPVTHKLRYDANGGSNAPTTQVADGEGKATVTSSVPTPPTGKVFDKWNTQNDGMGTDKAAGDVIDLSSADVTLYAIWRDPLNYTVSYNANGGTLKGGETDIPDAPAAEGSQVTVAANVYEKDGFVFSGWRLGEMIYNPGQKFTMPSQDAELVAQWNSLNVSDYALVTDIKQLKDEDEVYIVAYGYDRAMSTLSGSVRSEVEIQKTDDKRYLIISGTEPVKFTLGKDGNDYTFYDGANYLNWTSGNNLTNVASVTNDNAKWTIAISEEGVATISNKATSSRVIYYNNGYTRFACYTSTQKDVAIYKRPDFKREISSGNLGTICVPKAGRICGASLYEVAYRNTETGKIFFDEVIDGAVIAGRPYVFLPTSSESKVGVHYNDLTAADVAAGDYRGLHGSYIQAQIEDGVGNYIISNNQYREVATGGEAYVLPNRAYIVLNEIPTSPTPISPNRRRISIAGAPQSEQGMEDVQSTNNQCVKILINGQIFILRGEKMYDITGRLVK